ncbi:MAG TPA: glycosyltransferase family 2 protein [Tepidisphaeraceae bacterium]|nr:glycosyltransferase family 2 protein [Tepidisphaeraceae bacterium]
MEAATEVTLRAEKQEKPHFSIITVTLNAGDALGATVDSIRHQSFREFEHIVKDAGSSDGSIERYVRTEDGYAPMVVTKPDRGIYDAMNQALAHATGQYVLFLNAGDTLHHPEVLIEVARVAAAAPETGLLYGDYFSDRMRMVIRNPRRLSDYYLYRTTLCHQCCFVSREWIEKLGPFDPSLKILADYDFLLRLIVRGDAPARHCETIVCNYLGEGFSERPETAELLRTETDIVRARNFTPAERLRYGLLWAATLPRLRIWMMRSPNLRPIQRAYLRAVNAWKGSH